MPLIAGFGMLIHTKSRRTEFIINTLDSLVDDAMPHSKNGLVRISNLEPGKEILGS